ncbi:YigZ family protein [Bulleidia sp. zg-1006]|uniref:IMPACT family protein n=1 Tax=Bulleidia sp. zg-1006 TaxID=2806552 RepID=UPI0019397FF7|nr:YigZ family protein [Bulleidia sp. zg-1006]QRG86689.1 YigZ family protein [Bulleidia sp. zg-1006]
MQVKGRSEYEEIIKKSRFIAIVQRIYSLADAQEKISALRKEYPEATHVCYAYKVGQRMKSSDDHEPSGTAGIPILEALRYANLENTLVCVIRYFGGVKLGTGGLIRAYSSTASMALEKAPKTNLIPYYHFSIQYPYELSNRLEPWLYQNKTNPEFQYAEQVYCEFDYPKEDISREIQDLSKGKAQLKLLEVKKKEVDA